MTLASQAPQATAVGSAVNLPMSATGTAAGQPLTDTDTGLPGGLSINPSSGAITGTALFSASDVVTVTATDGEAYEGSVLSGNIAIPATGGWQTWATVTASVTVPAGQQVLTIAQDTSGWNLHSLAFAASSASANCSASLTGNQLARTSWAASTNTSGDPAANAIDGNLTTRFSSGAAQAPGQDLIINLGLRD